MELFGFRNLVYPHLFLEHEAAFHADDFLNNGNDNHVALLADWWDLIHRRVERNSLNFNLLAPEYLLNRLAVRVSNPRDLNAADILGDLRDGDVFLSEPNDRLMLGFDDLKVYLNRNINRVGRILLAELNYVCDDYSQVRFAGSDAVRIRTSR